MKIKHLIFPAIALLCRTILQGEAIAQPLDRYEQQVNNQLERVIQAASAEGYQLSFPRNVGRLARGAEAPKTVLLAPNRKYSFIAVCDTNCSDINLSIKDMEGKPIASDATGDAIAILNFQPTTSNRYQIIVKMEKCSTASCSFGLGIFTKDGNKALPLRRAGLIP